MALRAKLEREDARRREVREAALEAEAAALRAKLAAKDAARAERDARVEVILVRTEEVGRWNFFKRFLDSEPPPLPPKLMRAIEQAMQEKL